MWCHTPSSLHSGLFWLAVVRGTKETSLQVGCIHPLSIASMSLMSYLSHPAQLSHSLEESGRFCSTCLAVCVSSTPAGMRSHFIRALVCICVCVCVSAEAAGFFGGPGSIIIPRRAQAQMASQFESAPSFSLLAATFARDAVASDRAA